MEEKKESKLRESYAYRTKLLERKAILEKQRSVLNEDIHELDEKIEGLTKMIDSIEKRQIVLTTHFIIRYRERVGPEDIPEDDIKLKIVTPQLLNMVQKLGNGIYPVGDGVDVVVQDNKLITIRTPLPKERPIYKQTIPLKNKKVRKYRKR